MHARDNRRTRSKERAIDPRPLIIAVFVIALLVMLAQEAFADTLPLSIEEMTSLSEDVAVTDVLDTEAVFGARGEINTLVTLRAVSNLKGASESEFTITIPGGTLGERTDWVSDSPTFAIGDRVLLFLDARERVVAGRHGALPVVDNEVPAKSESLVRIEARILGREITPSTRRALPELFGLLADTKTVAQDEALEAASGSVTIAAGPSVSAVSPAVAPAGTGDTITITGSGFGSTAGSVEFFYREGRSAIVSSGSKIKEWSDTRIVTEVPTGLVDGYSAAAGSGPMNVVTSTGSRSADRAFTVSFAYGGSAWADPTQDYYVNPNTSDTTGELGMVQAAAATWSAAGSYSLTYAGSSSSTSIDASLGNGKNEIFWADLADGYLGQARYRTLSGTILEADFAFNSDVYIGTTRYPWGTGASGTFDVQSTALHELGHWLNLRDQYGSADSSEVMFGTGIAGTQKRSLHTYDLEGIRWIYDGSGDFTAPTTTASGVPGSWANSDVSITLSASDSGSGVDKTYYRIGAGSVTEYSTPITISSQGTTNLYFWSVDLDGNAESMRSVAIRIDRTDPVSSVSSAYTHVGTAHIPITVDDPLSGPGTTYYRVDSGALKTGTDVAVSQVGTHELRYYSRDAAGNLESEKSFSFEVLPAPGVSRLAGSTRYSTAIAASKKAFAAGSSPTVILATGAGFADALAASGLAGVYDAPLLLTTRSALSAELAQELDRLGATSVIVVGGPSAVEDSVLDSLRSKGLSATRVGGSDRYDTAAKVASMIAKAEGDSFAGEAFLARGDSFADALAAAPYAYAQRMPVLLTRPSSLPSTTRNVALATGIDHIYVAGGEAAVTPGVVASLGIPASRAAGADRYTTAAALADLAIGKGWVSPTVAGVTTGQNYPDALSGGAAIGAQGGIVLLTPKKSLCAPASISLDECATLLSEVQVLGGEGAVSAAVVSDIRSLWE